MFARQFALRRWFVISPSSALVLAACGGAGPEPGPSPTPPPPPPPTGVLAGDTVSAMIGTGGGTLALPNGSLTLTFPAGALAKATRIKIWPFVSTAPNPVGPEYAFEPANLTLLKPVHFSARIDPTTLAPDQVVEGLGVAQLNANGAWEGDAVTGSVSGSRGPSAPAQPGSAAADPSVDDELPALPHTAIVSFWQVRPARPTVATGAAVELTIEACFRAIHNVTRAELSRQCGPSVREVTWSVVGTEGRYGKVTALAPTSRSSYRAPFSLPPVNPVVITASMYWPERGLANTLPIRAKVTGSNDWTGTLEYHFSGETSTTRSGDIAPQLGGGHETQTTIEKRTGQGSLQLASRPGFMGPEGGIITASSSTASAASETKTTAVITGRRCTSTGEAVTDLKGMQAEVYSDPSKAPLVQFDFDLENGSYTLALAGLINVDLTRDACRDEYELMSWPAGRYPNDER